jgi:3-methyladenine DNA glycosylase Tag
VFGKRDAFRRAFHEFDVAQVAAMTERDLARLLQDFSIIRNRAKIHATVENARAMSAASPTLATLARSYERTRKRAPSVAYGPAHVDTPGRTVRQAAEVAEIPLRRTNERLRVHAERRRG